MGKMHIQQLADSAETGQISGILALTLLACCAFGKS